MLATGAACGRDEASTTTAAPEATTAETAELHPLPADSVVVSGTENHDRFRYFEEEGGWVWVVEAAMISDSEGIWRGTAQAVVHGWISSRE